MHKLKIQGLFTKDSSESAGTEEEENTTVRIAKN